MSFMEIYGVPLPVAECTETTDEIGSRVVSASGSVVRSVRAIKRQWRGKTPPLTDAEYQWWRCLLLGEYTSYPLASDAYQHSGAPATVAANLSYQPAPADGGAAVGWLPGAVITTAAVSSGVLYDCQATTGWTAGAGTTRATNTTKYYSGTKSLLLSAASGTRSAYVEPTTDTGRYSAAIVWLEAGQQVTLTCAMIGGAGTTTAATKTATTAGWYLISVTNNAIDDFIQARITVSSPANIYIGVLWAAYSTSTAVRGIAASNITGATTLAGASSLLDTTAAYSGYTAIARAAAWVDLVSGAVACGGATLLLKADFEASILDGSAAGPSSTIAGAHRGAWTGTAASIDGGAVTAISAASSTPSVDIQGDTLTMQATGIALMPYAAPSYALPYLSAPSGVDLDATQIYISGDCCGGRPCYALAQVADSPNLRVAIDGTWHNNAKTLSFIIREQ